MPIRNLILDLGGVLFAIDYRRPVDAFRKLGFPEFQRQFSQQEQHHFFDDFEKGLITIPVFRDRLRLRFNTSLPVSDQAIDAAWNSILVGFSGRQPTVTGTFARQVPALPVEQYKRAA